MPATAFFLPALFQILLTLILYIALAVAKAKAAKAGQVNLDRRALHADAWPDSVIKVNNNIRNQFEVPVLFYVVTLILWQLELTGMIVQGLSWVFVATRYMHSYIHTGSNDVPVRRRVFMVGNFVVIVLTLVAFGAIVNAPG